tara:strand:- start:195 stop:533 length:339 start_codon:yes stop_codon:yes gene_type:complete
MAFKMKGFSGFKSNGNPKDFARKQKIKAGKKLDSERDDALDYGNPRSEGRGKAADDQIDARMEQLEQKYGSNLEDAPDNVKADYKSLKGSRDKASKGKLYKTKRNTLDPRYK